MVRDTRIKTYTFQLGSLTGNNMTSGTGVGTIGSHFSSYTDHSLNGELRGIQICNNNWQPAGSLLLSISGTGEVIWKLISGTSTGNIAQSGLYMPVYATRNSENSLLSGTSLATYEKMPLFGIYNLVGSGVLGSATGFTICYQ